MNFDEMLAGLDSPKPMRPKRKILRDMVLTEISGVDKPAQPTAKMAIMKRAEPEPQGDQEAARAALALMQAELDKLTKVTDRLAYKRESASFEKTLSELCPSRENAAEDELQRLAEQHSDRTGLSLFDSYNVVLKQHPDLAKRAIDGSH